MSEKKGMIDDVKESIDNEDHVLGDDAPETPFVFVALSYLAALALMCGAIALWSWVA